MALRVELRTRKKTFWETLSEHSVSKIRETEFGPDYSDVYFEWTYAGYIGGIEGIVNALQRRGVECINESLNKCICGAPIKRKYLLFNPLTKKCAVIGHECKERFFMPEPGGRKTALAYIMYDLRNKIEVLEKVGGFDNLVRELRRLLSTTVYYIEKQTKYGRNLKVSRRFAREVEVYTGVKWKWGVWGNKDGELRG